MVTKTKSKRITKAQLPQRTIKPLPADVFPPLKLAKFLNGKLVGIEEIEDPRKLLTELYNASNERHGIPRRMGPIQGDPEDWLPEMAEEYHRQLEERMQDVEPVIDDPVGKFDKVLAEINKGIAARTAGKAVRT